MARQSANRRPDQRIAEIAALQHGVITNAQLLGAGVYSSGISNRLSAGRLHRIHRGVYAVGHSNLATGGRWMAAVLACGANAVLSHRSAAEFWRLLDPLPPNRGRSPQGSVDVTVRGDGGRRRRMGIVVHRSITLGEGNARTAAGYR
jgi:hypothetical protein